MTVSHPPPPVGDVVRPPTMLLGYLGLTLRKNSRVSVSSPTASIHSPGARTSLVTVLSRDALLLPGNIHGALTICKQNTMLWCLSINF